MLDLSQQEGIPERLVELVPLHHHSRNADLAAEVVTMEGIQCSWTVVGRCSHRRAGDHHK